VNPDPGRQKLPTKKGKVTSTGCSLWGARGFYFSLKDHHRGFNNKIIEILKSKFCFLANVIFFNF
jgi:hypothetical protein